MESQEVPKKEEKSLLHCGLIMPISFIDNCNPQHWLDVKNIVQEAINSINEYSFIVDLVSRDDSIGVIHKHIVQNIYSSEIIVCDLSAKNPNVMFELGMRLTFDKATVIIKDDRTDYSFDTGIIEHIEYPRDLRYPQIQIFKKALAERVKATYEKSIQDMEYSPFLKTFGKFQVPSISTEEVSPDVYDFNILKELQKNIELLLARPVNPEYLYGTYSNQAIPISGSSPGTVMFSPTASPSNNPANVIPYRYVANINNPIYSPSTSASPSGSPSAGPDDE